MQRARVEMRRSTCPMIEVIGECAPTPVSYASLFAAQATPDGLLTR
jgi:hypothetical protein